MPSELVIELFDGSALVLDGKGAPPRAEQEFSIWGLVPDEASKDAVDRHRDPVTWQSALDAGPLLYTAFQGVIGNAAWAAFPAAARHLSALWRGKHRPVDDAPSAGNRVADAARALYDDAEAEVSVTSVRRDGEGVWHVEFILDGREGIARLTSDGAVTHVKFRTDTSSSRGLGAE